MASIRVPLQWAGAQTNLGNALWKLGERESGTARLKEAVEACRAALQEWTREGDPFRWAMAQNSLGYTLAILGDLEDTVGEIGDRGPDVYETRLQASV